MAFPRLLAPRRPAPLIAALPQQSPAKPSGMTFGRDRPLPWQTDAWRFYDDIGMIKYYGNFRANAFAKVRLFVGVIDPGGGTPIPIDDPEAKIDPRIAALAMKILDDLRDPVEGQSGILRGIGLNEAIVGECRLLGRDDRGPETWEVFSNEELRRGQDNRWELRSDPYSTTPDEILPDGVYVKRLWRPHPRRKALADCAMRGVLKDCAALELLESDIMATAQSRLGAGVLALKKGIDGQHFSPEDRDDEEPSEFVDNLIEHMAAPIRNPGTAAAVIPLVSEFALGTGERLSDVIQLISFDRKMDPVLAAQREEKRKVIAGGLDLPEEVLLGMGASTNHWSAWAVDDQTWKGHLEPDVLTMCSQITSGYLRPIVSAELAAGDGALLPAIMDVLDRIVVWYDPAGVVNHPDRGKDALDVYNAFELSGDALRTYKGFAETDKPDPDEVAARVEQQRLIHSRGAEPGVIPSGDVTTEGPVSPATVVKGPPPTPTETAPPKATTASLVASASTRSLSERFLTLDQRLRARVEAAADTAVRRGMERAGNRIATKVARQPALKATVAGVARGQAAAALGRSVVASLDLTDDDLLDGCFDDLADQTDTWVEDTQRSALTILVNDLRAHGVQIATVASIITLLKDRGQTPTAALILTGLADSADGRLSATLRDTASQITTDAEAGRTQLLTSLQARARDLLYSPDPLAQPADGEWDGTVLVSAGLVRGALNLYGGGPTVPGGFGDSQELPAPSQAVAAGSRMLGLADAGGYTITAYQWVIGSPEHPFIPHQDLDGAIFEGPDDSRLSASEDAAWLDSATGGYWIGDHRGCQCDCVPLLSYDAGSSDIAQEMDAA